MIYVIWTLLNYLKTILEILGNLGKGILKICKKCTGEHPHVTPHTSTCKFAAYFQNTIFWEHLRRAAGFLLWHTGVSEEMHKICRQLLVVGKGGSNSMITMQLYLKNREIFCVAKRIFYCLHIREKTYLGKIQRIKMLIYPSLSPTTSRRRKRMLTKFLEILLPSCGHLDGLCTFFSCFFLVTNLV